MAETLSVTDMLHNKFEPKRNYRWVLAIEGIDSFLVKTTKRPDFSLTEKKIDFINQNPQEIDGVTQIIKYDKDRPLTEELKYFVDHLDGKSLSIANGDHALEVSKILLEAASKLQSTAK